MATWGANADQLDGVAAAMGRAASLLEGIRVQLTAEVHHAPWRGHQADAFRRDWDANYQYRLQAATGFLRDAQTQIHANAAQQRNASAAPTAAGPGAAATGPGLARLAGATGLTASVLASLMTVVPRLGKSWNAVRYGDEGLSLALNQWSLLKLIRAGSVPNGVLSYLRSEVGPNPWRTLTAEATGPDLNDIGIDAGSREGFLSVLGIGMSSAKVGADLASGDLHDAAWDGGNLAFNVLTSPPVSDAMPVLGTAGLMVGAAQFGWDTGHILNNEFHISEHVSDAVVGDSVQSLYGHDQTNLTPAEAAQYSHRYDGISGFVNMTHDVGKTTINRLKSLI